MGQWRHEKEHLGGSLRELSSGLGLDQIRDGTLSYAVNRRPGFFERRWSRPVPASSEWPTQFVPIDLIDPPSVGPIDDLAQHRFSFATERHCVDELGGWLPNDRTRAFRSCLHSFRWAWSLAAADPKRHRPVFEELWKSWRSDVPFGNETAWNTKVAAERAWVLCAVFGTLAEGTAVSDDVLGQLGLHAGFLYSNRGETTAGHECIASLKAQIGLGVLLDDTELLDVAAIRLGKEIDKQVLADGGHYERSASLHCQVLGDLIDVGGLGEANDLGQIDGLHDAVERMREWLGTMLMPDGDVPLFGDSTLVGQKRLAAIEPAERPAERLIHFEQSGYVVCRPDERLHVVCDVGATWPADRSNPAHASCLSFVAAVDGDRAIVDTGVSTHDGMRGAYERSTAAHNTVEIGEVDQFETGHRASVFVAAPVVHTIEDQGVLVVDVSHDGYRRLVGEPVHHRRFEIGHGRIVLRDHVDGTGFHRLFSRLFLAPGISAEFTDDGEGPDVLGAPFSLIRTTLEGEAVPAWVVYSSVARSLGDRTACRSVWWEIWEDLPQQFVTEIVLEEAGVAE